MSEELIEKKAQEKKAQEKKAQEKKDAEKKNKKIEHKIDGRKIGTTIIERVEEVVINGRDYNKVTTMDGQIFMLNDKDLNSQVSK